MPATRSRTLDGQDMANDLVEPLAKYSVQTLAFERVIEPGVERVDVDRQAMFTPEVIVDILVGWKDMLRVEPQAPGKRLQEAPGECRVGTVVASFVGVKRGIVPYRLAVAPPEAVQRPARQLLAGIPLALTEVLQTSGRVALAQTMVDLRRADALGWAEGVGVPLGTVMVVDRDKGRLAAHRQADVAGREVGVDLMAQRFDRQPLFLAVWPGDSRRLPDALDLHVMLEAALTLLGEAGDRRRGRWLRRTRQRDVALASKQARGRVESDPAGARQVNLTPGMQIGEVVVGPRRAVERLHIGHELDQIAGNETRRQTKVPQELYQQPGRIATRATGQGKRLLGRLYAGFQADDIAHRMLHPTVEIDEKIDTASGIARNRPEEAAQQGGQRQALQIGLELFLLPGLVGEGKVRGIGFGEEVEGIDHRHAGHQVDFDAELARLLGKDQAGKIVCLRVLLPVDEMPRRGDLQRVAENRRPRMRRRPQPDDLR